jgi:hypothetical protein
MQKDKYRGRDVVNTATIVLVTLVIIAIALLFIIRN